MFSYTVRCCISDPSIAVKWLSWLKDQHIQDVIDAGATSAEIFQMEDGQTYEIRYQFATKSEFEAYESNHAPRLRKEGLEKFPLEMGLEYSRSTGQLIFELGG